MTFVKGAVFLLLLAAVSINADHHGHHDNCDGLNVTIPGSELHKIEGDWVLVWSTSDSTMISVENLTSSHVNVHLSHDNTSMIYTERNRFRDASCSTYNASFSVTSDLHTVNLEDMIEDKDGVVAPFNDSATAQFFVTCPDCASMVYRGNYGNFLLIYVREGHHMDLAKIAESHADYQKLSACLGIPLERGFIYKGANDFCHKTLAPPAPPAPPAVPAIEEVVAASDA